MLVRPDISDEAIRDFVRRHYGVDAAPPEFLPLGADFNAAAFRVAASGGDVFFLKLRRGIVAPYALAAPRLLADHGVAEVVAPMRCLSGDLSAPLAGFTAILYPFVDALPAHERPIPSYAWERFGATLRRIHDAPLPPAIAAGIPGETFDTRHRDPVRRALTGAEAPPADGAARGLIGLLAARRDTIVRLVGEADALAGRLTGVGHAPVLCHADLHAANVLVSADGALHIVDWDAPVLAPRERDLMFVGAGIVGVWNRPDEEARFLAGYGPPAPDPAALAYYRIERVITDIAETCALLFGGHEGRANRRQALDLLAQQFGPGDVIDIALATLARAEGPG